MGYFSELSSEAKRTLLICGVGVGAAVGTAAIYRHYHQQSNQEESFNWQQVGVVSKLFVYPARSCRGVQVDDVYVENQGPALRKDRGHDR